MIYIYDILLNWTDLNIWYDFYEWEKKDTIEHIKKIPLLKVSKECFDEVITHEIIAKKTWLEKIKNHTEVYRNKKIETISYACILSDGSRIIAIEFNRKGVMNFHSKFLLDEEDDLIDLSIRLDSIPVEYELGKKLPETSCITRKELEMMNYLLSELESAKNQKEQEKITYLYQEYFENTNVTYPEMYQKLKDSFSSFNEKHEELYHLLKLSHTKKNVS